MKAIPMPLPLHYTSMQFCDTAVCLTFNFKLVPRREVLGLNVKMSLHLVKKFNRLILFWANYTLAMDIWAGPFWPNSHFGQSQLGQSRTLASHTWAKVTLWPKMLWPKTIWPVTLWPKTLWPVTLWPITLWPKTLWPVTLWPITLWLKSQNPCKT